MEKLVKMKEINEWEVLTPDGWKDFSGIVEFEKTVITITFNDGTELTGSNDHRVETIIGMLSLKELTVGILVVGKYNLIRVIKISHEKEKQKVYDLVEVECYNHQYYTNDIISHNCDEMAFIPNRIQNEFMAGTAPALSSTNGKMIVTSTPNGSKDLFAKLWFGTGMEWDKKDFTYLKKNASKNRFIPLFIPYWIDPTKNNDAWIAREKGTLDDILKWKVEFECLVGDTEIEVYDEIEDIFKIITLETMSKILMKDAVDSQFIIHP